MSKKGKFVRVEKTPAVPTVATVMSHGRKLLTLHREVMAIPPAERMVYQNKSGTMSGPATAEYPIRRRRP